jgi:hypothetical protein
VSCPNRNDGQPKQEQSRNPADELIHGVRFYPIRKKPATKFIEVGDLLALSVARRP